MSVSEEIKNNVEIISKIFKKERFTLSIAESFTGGNVVASFIAIPGASSFLLEGLTCYSNESKRLRLNVASETLKQFGAVSENTVREMVAGLLKSSLKPDFVVATTGNAGPGVEPLSNAGECYVAVGNNKSVLVKKLSLVGDRDDNILDGTLEAIKILINFVKIHIGE